MDPLPAGFRGAARRMQPADLVALAKPGGYEVATLQAVMDVEAAGAGFDAAGRPKMLVERHVFYAQLGAGPKRTAAVRAGLAYLSWGTLPYPATPDGCYAVLARMMAVDPAAALRSCSWGIGQVMGFNHVACGYPDVQAMVTAAADSEIAQFGMLLRFVEHAGLAAALKRRDWTTFARGYNGSGQVDAYAGKLAAAYAARTGAVAVQAAIPANETAALNDAALAAARPGSFPR